VLTVAKHFKWLHPLFVAPKSCEFVARATVTAVMGISRETTVGWPVQSSACQALQGYPIHLVVNRYEVGLALYAPPAMNF
jgi:hypothetical protein